MADKKPSALVKVKANYEGFGDSQTLWGVQFTKDSKGNLVAELSEADAQALIDAGRVTKL
jgi:hypothetical protein